MQYRFHGFLAGAFLLCALPQAARPCSTFCFEQGGQWVYGRNYDWKVDDGLVVVNRRHVARIAATQDNPASWTAKYGSVTFNQYGCGFPHGGMNEAGLVIEQMWLNATKYPIADSRAALDNLQWIQYQLDNCSSVAEVLSSDGQLRIVPNGALIHYLVCDAGGNCAAVEFLDGKMVAHTGDALPFRVLTNNTYTESAAYLQRFAGFGGTETIPSADGSLDRFACAAALIRSGAANPGQSPVERAFSILEKVAQAQSTQWSIVYELGAKRIAFRTRRAPEVRTIDMKTLDFSCRQPAALLDIHAPGSGDVLGSFKPYSAEQNRKLVWAAYRKTEFTANLPDEVLEAIARYPEADICRD
jgi:choloylglycine hydrolase